MKKSLHILALITLANFAVATEDNILAKVDGKPIYESEIKATMKSYAKMNSDSGEADDFTFDKMEKDAKKEIIKTLVIGELLLKEAKKAKVDQSNEYKDGIELAGKQLAQKLFIDKLIKDNITEDKLRKKYDEVIKAQGDREEFKVSHILLKTEEEAKEVKAQLDKGADFAKLAKEKSLDGNKDSGGSLGYFTFGQMVPAFENATAALKIGQISEPVQTEFGYHIIKLEDKRKAKPETFEMMRSKISDMLAAQYIQEYIEQLQKQNKVELF